MVYTYKKQWTLTETGKHKPKKEVQICKQAQKGKTQAQTGQHRLTQVNTDPNRYQT